MRLIAFIAAPLFAAPLVAQTIPGPVIPNGGDTSILATKADLAAVQLTANNALTAATNATSTVASTVKTICRASANGPTASGVVTNFQLLGSVIGVCQVVCTNGNEMYRVNVEGVFTTPAVPGTITPAMGVGGVLVSRPITNAVNGATNAHWRGQALISCRSTTSAAVDGNVNYAAGTLLEGSAAINNDGTDLTLATGPRAITFQVSTSAAGTSIGIRNFLLEQVGG